MIAGGAAALYYLSKKKAEEAGQATQGIQSAARAAPNAQMAIAPQVVVAPDAPDDDGTINYGPWGWATPVFGGRAWRTGGGGRGGGHGHGGHH